MAATTVLTRAQLSVVDYACIARPGDPMVVEHHAAVRRRVRAVEEQLRLPLVDVLVDERAT